MTGREGGRGTKIPLQQNIMQNTTGHVFGFRPNIANCLCDLGTEMSVTINQHDDVRGRSQTGKVLCGVLPEVGGAAIPRCLMRGMSHDDEQIKERSGHTHNKTPRRMCNNCRSGRLLNGQKWSGSLLWDMIHVLVWE